MSQWQVKAALSTAISGFDVLYNHKQRKAIAHRVFRLHQHQAFPGPTAPGEPVSEASQKTHDENSHDLDEDSSGEPTALPGAQDPDWLESDDLVRSITQRLPQSQFSMGTPEPDPVFLTVAHLNNIKRGKLRELSRLYESSEQVWVMDWEFTVLTNSSGFCAVPYEGSIYTLQGEHILTTRVRWPGITKSKLCEALRPHLSDKDHDARSRCVRMVKGQFDKFYGEDVETAGMTIVEIRDFLLQHPKYPHANPDQLKVLSWHTSIDINIFYRILRAKDNSILASNVKHHQPVNVSNLAANMLPIKQDADIVKRVSSASGLAAIHKLLWPTKFMRWHRAEADTKGMCNIIKVMVEIGK